jgi:hypothetical protein
MPRYDYLCEQNKQVIEVSHALGQPLKTWGELCERVGIALGDTPADAPVERLLSAPGMLMGAKAERQPKAPAAPVVHQHQCGHGCKH